MTGDSLPCGRLPLSAEASTPDAAVREIVRLLGLVAEEERALARLQRCVAD